MRKGWSSWTKGRGVKDEEGEEEEEALDLGSARTVPRTSSGRRLA